MKLSVIFQRLHSNRGQRKARKEKTARRVKKKHKRERPRKEEEVLIEKTRIEKQATANVVKINDS